MGKFLEPRPAVFFLLLFFSLVSLPFAGAEEFHYNSHGRRDPFIAPQADLSGLHFGQGSFRLEGVILDVKGGSYAIVNGEIVKEGTVFEGYLLKKVGKNQAVFEKDGEAVEVVLRDDDELLRQM